MASNRWCVAYFKGCFPFLCQNEPPFSGPCCWERVSSTGVWSLHDLPQVALLQCTADLPTISWDCYEYLVYMTHDIWLRNCILELCVPWVIHIRNVLPDLKLLNPHSFTNNSYCGCILAFVYLFVMFSTVAGVAFGTWLHSRHYGKFYYSSDIMEPIMTKVNLVHFQRHRDCDLLASGYLSIYQRSTVAKLSPVFRAFDTRRRSTCIRAGGSYASWMQAVEW